MRVKGIFTNRLTQERPDDIKHQNIPPSWHRTCRDWAAFTNVDVVDEIDSGL